MTLCVCANWGSAADPPELEGEEDLIFLLFEGKPKALDAFTGFADDRSISSLHAELKANIMGPTDLYVKSGSDINLTCKILQGPHELGNIFWYKGNEIIDMTANQNEIDSGTRISVENDWTDGLTSRLKIRRALSSDTGNYTCVPTIAKSSSVYAHTYNLKQVYKWHPVLLCTLKRALCSHQSTSIIPPQLQHQQQQSLSEHFMHYYSHRASVIKGEQEEDEGTESEHPAAMQHNSSSMHKSNFYYSICCMLLITILTCCLQHFCNDATITATGQSSSTLLLTTTETITQRIAVGRVKNSVQHRQNNKNNSKALPLAISTSVSTTAPAIATPTEHYSRHKELRAQQKQQQQQEQHIAR
uniref:Ig-like domain-containing protein n=1 Tax=Glossina morsitans morsitans TaxID=37546 RepID=A0A1B0FN16_GLOMM